MLIGIQRRSHSAGLPLAYFLGTSLLHAPGAALYLRFPEWDALAVQTQLGFTQTIYGLIAFLVGVLLARQTASTVEPVTLGRRELALLDRIARFYVFAGICYFLLSSLLTIPSLTSLVSQLSSLLVVGISLRLWVAYQQRSTTKFWTTIALLPLLPAVTLIKSAFLGVGTGWLMTAVSFAFSQSKRRAPYFVAAPLVVFLGLSVFVNYMAARMELRRAVWYHDVGLAERLERVDRMFRDFEWLDLQNPKQRDVIDGRLNQNIIIGAAEQRLQAGQVGYAYGATLIQVLVGLIPRALWPNKPQVGGGGTMVSQYTGMTFAEGTSVGAGQIFEFYVNFGTLGVIGGMLVYGWMIGFMDLRIIEALYERNYKDFLFWFLVCLALLQPEGNFLEIGTSAVASGIVARIISTFVDNRFKLGSANAVRRKLPVT